MQVAQAAVSRFAKNVTTKLGKWREPSIYKRLYHSILTFSRVYLTLLGIHCKRTKDTAEIASIFRRLWTKGDWSVSKKDDHVRGRMKESSRTDIVAKTARMERLIGIASRISESRNYKLKADDISSSTFKVTSTRQAIVME